MRNVDVYSISMFANERMSSSASVERGVMEHLKGFGKLDLTLSSVWIFKEKLCSRNEAGGILVTRLDNVPIFVKGFFDIENGYERCYGNPNRRECHIAAWAYPIKLRYDQYIIEYGQSEKGSLPSPKPPTCVTGITSGLVKVPIFHEPIGVERKWIRVYFLVM